MKELNLLDEAQLKAEFKNAYRELGMSGCTQILYELILSAQLLVDIMIEESKK